ncbi:MAG: rod-binding protein [Thermoleophilia bacterium]|nr:rod-binding protein [Thermoleophilia bacterium]
MIVPIPPNSAAAPAAPAAASGTDPAIREAAEGFEGIFMSMLVEEMLKGTQVAEGNPVYAGLMTQKFGDQLARSGGIGLADVLERQLGSIPPAAGGAS